MTAWTSPRTYTIGEKITKMILDTHVRDNLLHLKELLNSGTVTALTPESAIFPITDTSAGLQQRESSASSPKANWLELSFPSTSDAYINWRRILPSSIGATATLRLYGYMATATTGNIGFGVRLGAISSGDSGVTSKAFATTNLGSQAVPAVAGTAFTLDITISNQDSMTGDDEVVIALYRNTAVASNASGICYITNAKLILS